MRIISIIGIILLLSLQYIWINNAYKMVEQDIMGKSKECLREAVDEELFERLDRAKIEVSVQDRLEPSDKIIMRKVVNRTSKLFIEMEGGISSLGYHCSTNRVNVLFRKKISDRLGFLPEYTLRIINDCTRFKITNRFNSTDKSNKHNPQIDSTNYKESCITDDTICRNIIFIKMGTERSFELVLTSPAASVINKSKYIFFISILLVLLIGVILVFQFKSMMKDKEFTAFMKDYTRMLAHELRTPINGIHMLTSRLMSDNLMNHEKRTIYHKENLNQCSRILLAIDNILLVAKTEQSTLSIFKSNTNMRQLIERIVDKFRDNYFQQKNLNIATQYAPENCMAYIDPDLMENVLINLIENAIKYSNETVDILISCSVENGRLLLSIRDNGFGIGKDDQKNIFKIFRRGTKIEGKQIKGFGIGLYYVQKVIEAHRGKVNIISEEGIGSEFIIDIPNRFL